MLSLGGKYGSVATFSCNDGYTQSGDKSIKCNARWEDVRWGQPEVKPTCKGEAMLPHRCAGGQYMGRPPVLRARPAGCVCRHGSSVDSIVDISAGV